MWRSHIKGSPGSNVSCISVDIQPPLGISANLIPARHNRGNAIDAQTVLKTNKQTKKYISCFAAASYLRAELSGSEAILLFSKVPGTTDSGTTICMGSSLKCGASFSLTTVTTTVAVLTGRFGALLLRGLRFSTVSSRTYSSCASKSKGCMIKQSREYFWWREYFSG